MKNFVKLLILLLIISLAIKLWLNAELKDMVNLNKENIKNLDFTTNKNFTPFGIENIGINLRDELLRMDIDKADKEVLIGFPFYFFQANELKIKNKDKVIEISLNYSWYHSVFRIKGYRT
jgi:hypothetical protein